MKKPTERSELRSAITIFVYTILTVLLSIFLFTGFPPFGSALIREIALFALFIGSPILMVINLIGFIKAIVFRPPYRLLLIFGHFAGFLLCLLSTSLWVYSCYRVL